MGDVERLRELIPDPTPAAEAAARRRLRALIDAERRPARTRRPISIAAAAGLVVVVVMAAVWIAQPRAEAILEQLASAVEAIPAPALPEGSYLLARSEESTLTRLPGEMLPSLGRDEVALLERRRDELWLGADGSRMERVTEMEPAFFDEATAAAFRASELPALLGVGESTTTTYPPGSGYRDPATLPTDPVELEDYLVAGIRMSGKQATPAALMDAAANLVIETAAPPELRASVLRVLDRTEGLTVRAGDDGDGFAVEVSAEADHENGRALRVVRFDAEGRPLSSTLTHLDGIPAIGLGPGTVVEQTDYRPATVVEELPVP